MKYLNFLKLFNKNIGINYKEFFRTHKDYSNAYNKKVSQYVSFIAVLFGFVGILICHSVKSLYVYRPIYTLFFLVSLAFGIILLINYKNFKNAIVFTYIMFGFIYLFAAILGTVYNHDKYSAIYIGIAILLELLIMDRPWHIGTFAGFMNSIFILLTFTNKPFEIAFVDTVNSIIMLTIGYLMVFFNTGNVIINIQNKENEINSIIKENKMQITASQVKPHFIFNALTTIQYLCKTDPKSAEQTVSHLAKYIRTNMESVDNNTLIPFQSELDHLQNYLYIEKLRYDDRLDIKYNIEVPTDFLIPFFSIQPLVENAIRHGIAKRENGGTVTISAYEKDNSYIIKIIDNGIGFNPKKRLYDGKQHFGLEIVRSRIEGLCGGKFTIESLVGIGTTSIIQLPKNLENNLSNS